jgi:hypothetical protein
MLLIEKKRKDAEGEVGRKVWFRYFTTSLGSFLGGD